MKKHIDPGEIEYRTRIELETVLSGFIRNPITRENAAVAISGWLDSRPDNDCAGVDYTVRSMEVEGSSDLPGIFSTDGSKSDGPEPVRVDVTDGKEFA